MSEDAVRLMKEVRGLYAKAGTPDFKVWNFDPGIDDSAHAELAAAGFLMRVFGTKRGFAWRLTDAGHAHLLALGSKP